MAITSGAYAMKDDTKLAWMTVDTNSLNQSLKAKWQALQKIRAQEKLAREEFESAFISTARKVEAVDKDMSLAFGYRFGGLAVAKVDPAESKAKSSSKPKFSF
jgi:2-oxoglutarate dehydrogenase complex dehydrogenase (E1) component-like enzyme